MNNPIINVTQIGCGYWGPNLLRSFSSLPGCQVKWVVDPAPPRRAYVETNFPKSRAVADWTDAVADPEVSAVVIATPAATHTELARACLRANKHVFVEKPLAMTAAAVEELSGLARQAGRILMVGHTFLYNAAVRYARKLIEASELGQLYYIYSQRLNLGQVRNDVNAWWNLAPHDVSILLYWMNGQPPVSVAAHGVSYIQPGIEDVVFATLRWDDGMTAHIHVSWLDPGKVRTMTIVGSRKMVVYDDIGEEKIAIYDKGVERVPKVGERMDYDKPGQYQILHRWGDVLLPRINFPEPLKVEAEHFLDCIRTGQPPLTGARHARDVVAVLEAGQQSLARQGAPVQPR